MTDVPRTQIQASDEEIETAFSNLGYSLTVEDLSFGAADEISAFRTIRKQWAKLGRVSTDAAATAGQRKRDVVIIRFGKYCAIYGMD